LGGEESGRLSHVDLEQRLRVEGAELLRQLFQDHLDVRAGREQRADGVVGALNRSGSLDSGDREALSERASGSPRSRGRRVTDRDRSLLR